jgi:hypothetical protein
MNKFTVRSNKVKRYIIEERIDKVRALEGAPPAFKNPTLHLRPRPKKYLGRRRRYKTKSKAQGTSPLPTLLKNSLQRQPSHRVRING